MAEHKRADKCKTASAENKEKWDSKQNSLAGHALNNKGVAHYFLSREFVHCALRAKRQLGDHTAIVLEANQKFEVRSDCPLASHLIPRLICTHGGRTLELDPVVLEYNARTGCCCLLPLGVCVLRWSLLSHHMQCEPTKGKYCNSGV